MDGDKFNCHACCFGHHCDDDSLLPGSRGPAPVAMHAIAGVIESRTCLLPMVTPASREWLRLYDERRAGLLPVAGGVLDQPAAWREAMRLVEHTVNGIQRERAKQRG